jgi:hypothetical protein
MRIFTIIFLMFFMCDVSIAKSHHRHRHHHHNISINQVDSLQDSLSVNVVLPDQKNRPSHYIGTISIDEHIFPYATGGAGRGSAPYGTFPIQGIHTYGPYPWNSFALGSKNLRIPDPKYPKSPRTGILIHPGRDTNVKRLRSRGCFSIPRHNFSFFKSILLEKTKREGPQYLTINKDGSAAIIPRGKNTIQVSSLVNAQPKPPVEENRIVKTVTIQKPVIIIKQRTSTLTTFIATSGYKLTVATHLVPRWNALVADFVAAGYRPRHVSCFASGGHVPNSRHYYGAACDFDQYGWGLTVPFMYHAHRIIVKHGFRDGCDFNDCGHVDDGLPLYRRHNHHHQRHHNHYNNYDYGYNPYSW